VGVAPTFLCHDWPLLQLPLSCEAPFEATLCTLELGSELEPCQRQGPQAEWALGGGTPAGELSGMWSPSMGASLVLRWQKQLQMQLCWNNRMCQVLIIEVVGDEQEPQRGSLSAKSLNLVCSSGKQKENSLSGP
jgi:hypothetical protein